jgi:CRISPR type III-B/RAMP module-associated protein Cmr3
MTLTLFFEPLDALFFRDHRPFHAARNFEAFSRFPSPTVFWGCLRTALLRADDRGWFAARPSRKQVDDALGAFALTLRGPTFASRTQKGVKPLLPYPMGGHLPHAVRPRQPGLLTPLHFDFRGGGVRQTTDRLPTLPAGKPKGDSALLVAHGLNEALAGQPTEVEVPSELVYRLEPRFGIARDPQRRSVRDGLFYSLEYWRFAHPFGFAVELETTRPDEVRRRLDGRNVTLGGKGGRATVYVHDGGYLPKAPTGAQAFYWLLAPLPVTATLPAGVISRVTETKGLPEGGFDLAERSPKPLVAVYPAGTLFFTDQPPVALTHIDNPLACTGLGSTLVGTW